MPIYEYQCSTCGKSFEEIRPFAKADEPATCPDCFNPNARRQLTKRFASSGNSSVGCSGCSSGNCSSCGH